MPDFPIMTPQIAFDAIHNEAFKHVLMETMKEQELIDQFCRLYKCEQPKRRDNPIEDIVDQVTGFRQHQWNEFFKQFIPFVHRAVYMPLLCQLEGDPTC